MDPVIFQAIAAIITSLISGGCVAFAAVLNTRKSTALMELQLTQIGETIKEFKSKLDEVADLKAEIGKINVRLDGLEKDIDDLKK